MVAWFTAIVDTVVSRRVSCDKALSALLLAATATALVAVFPTCAAVATDRASAMAPVAVCMPVDAAEETDASAMDSCVTNVAVLSRVTPIWLCDAPSCVPSAAREAAMGCVWPSRIVATRVPFATAELSSVSVNRDTGCIHSQSNE